MALMTVLALFEPDAVSDWNLKSAAKRTPADRFHEFHARYGRLQLASRRSGGSGHTMTRKSAMRRLFFDAKWTSTRTNQPHDGALRVTNLGAVPDEAVPPSVQLASVDAARTVDPETIDYSTWNAVKRM
jgi:hypothetical protein